MKVKINNIRMKIKAIIVLLFVAGNSGFSQENVNIVLNSQQEHKTTVTLRPLLGVGDKITIPVVLSWEKESKIIKVEFKGDERNKGKYIYSFSKPMHYKMVTKSKNNVWFDKEMKQKYLVDRNVEKNVKDNELVNVRLENESPNNEINVLAFNDPAANLTFSFREAIPKNGNVYIIPMTFYVASFESKKFKLERCRKIEYMAKFTLNITLQDICENADLTNAIAERYKEIEKMRTDIKTIESEKAELRWLTDEKKKELANKQSIGTDKKITKISDKYQDCENSKKAVKDYNDVIDDYNNFVNEFLKARI